MGFYMKNISDGVIFSVQRIDMLSLIGGTPSYLSKPPKEHLVEKASMVSFDISYL